jgi:hypothetical protein
MLLVGCAGQGDEGFFILNNTAPSGGACALSGDPNQAFLAHGAISNVSPVAYFFTPLIVSRIEALAGHESQRTIHIQGARVELQAASSTGTLAAVSGGNFTALVSGSVDPSGSVNVGFDLIPVSIINSFTADTEVQATVTMFGTMGDTQIDAEPFQYPVTVCTNCIVVDNGACPMTGSPRVGNPCNVFQDGIVDCCESAGGLICPAATM